MDIHRRYRIDRKTSSYTFFKYLTYCLVLLACVCIMYVLSKQKGNDTIINTNTASRVEVAPPSDGKDFLPTSKGEVVRHKFYTLSYIEKYEQAEWVAYQLTRDLLKLPNVPRSDWFEVDPEVSTGSAKHSDYSSTGYTRGHMVPSGDMSFDKLAEKETFFMSNMSPQLKVVNNGIWKELEEQTRDWTYQNDEVYIVSGPIFDGQVKYLKNKVAVPTAFYKIILDVKETNKKAIAFIIPYERSERHLREYATTIDNLEAITGIDFFAHFLDKTSIEKLESKIDITQWPISDARFKLRVEKWNNQ